MSKETSIQFIENLKSVGLTSDQIFQLLIEKEKTNQLQEERRIKELEHQTDKNQGKKRPSETSDSIVHLYKKLKQQELRKYLMDLCDEELLLIFEYLPNFTPFKMGLVSKRLRDLVLERVNCVNLLNQESVVSLSGFLMSEYTDYIQTLIIKNCMIGHGAAKAILNYCCNLKELSLSIDRESRRKLEFKDFESAIKNLKKLHISCGCHYSVEFNNIYLYNLKDLSIDGLGCPMEYYLNERVNNITTLCLENISYDQENDIELPNLERLTLKSCDVSKICVNSLLNSNQLKFVELSYISNINDGEANEPISIELPSLEKLILRRVETEFLDPILNSNLSGLKHLIMRDIVKSNALILSANTSIKCLKTFKIEKSIGKEVFHTLTKSSLFFKVIENIEMDFRNRTLDTKSLLYISGNTKLFRNLKRLILLTEETCKFEGYEQFFGSTHLSNIEYLSIVYPDNSKHLMYLAKTNNFPSLKELYVFDTYLVDECPLDFFSIFANNSTFQNLEELGLSFIDEDSIRELLDSSLFAGLQLLVVSESLSARGFKELEESGLEWMTFESIEHNYASSDEEDEEDEDEDE